MRAEKRFGRHSRTKPLPGIRDPAAGLGRSSLRPRSAADFADIKIDRALRPCFLRRQRIAADTQSRSRAAARTVPESSCSPSGIGGTSGLCAVRCSTATKSAIRRASPVCRRRARRPRRRRPPTCPSRVWSSSSNCVRGIVVAAHADMRKLVADSILRRAARAPSAARRPRRANAANSRSFSSARSSCHDAEHAQTRPRRTTVSASAEHARPAPYASRQPLSARYASARRRYSPGYATPC